MTASPIAASTISFNPEVHGDPQAIANGYLPRATSVVFEFVERPLSFFARSPPPETETTVVATRTFSR